MEVKTLLTKYRNTVFNLGIILVAVFIAFRIYVAQNTKINDLKKTRDTEFKKGELLKEISKYEKKITVYQQVFNRKEMSDVINNIAQMGRDSKVKIIAIKPGGERKGDNYSELTVDVNINASDYHSVGDFISRLENSVSLYTVNRLYIKSLEIRGEAKSKQQEDRLWVETNISTIIF